jgi:serine/threonine-protein kinase RsbW
MTLGYVSAGINYFMASARNLHGLVKVPGSLLGVNDDPDFEEQKLAVQAGDVFYFVTDGLMDAMIRNIPVYLDDFDRTLAAMRVVAPSGGGHDDASALCLRIRGPFRWPLVFELSQPEELKYLRGRLRGILNKIMNKQALAMEIVLNEAINNALRSVDQAETALVRIKINKVGFRLILRIRDSGRGFNVNDKISLLKREEAAQAGKPGYEEGGRGLTIMRRLSDRLVFNLQGNEVLVMKKIQG